MNVEELKRQAEANEKEKVSEETVSNDNEVEKENESVNENETVNENGPINETEPENEEDTSDSEDKKEKKKDKKEKKDKKDEKIEELTDRVLRQMAEFENFRKRSEKEKAMMFDIGAKAIIEKLLPIMDNFERGIAAIPEGEKDNSYAKGMEMIYKQMLTAFDEAGVKAMETVGQTFDPNLHNAVMHIEDENFGENTVAEEFQKGYTYHDSVVRCAMVKVAN